MYDAIVVGARCAGSPTAMLLARKGYRVLLVDRATFPSDSMRNHFIQHDGVKQLHAWGLLDKIIAAGTPPIRIGTSDLGDFPLSGTPPLGDGVDAEYAPRRLVLDKILVDAANEAGAEVREGFSVLEIIMEDGRVTGIGGKSKGGSTVTERARIVIGADGQHSIVARKVGAATYNEVSALTCAYYSYWSGIPCEGGEVWIKKDPPAFLLAFPTNFGLTCVATQVPVGEFEAFRSDIEGNFLKTVTRAPDLVERVLAGRREERFLGSADLPNFFRKPYGAGWALVGDASYHKDPFTARGISDAFRDAEFLANAIDEGFSGRRKMEDVLAEYETKRNEVAFPQYEQACQSASFAPIPDELYRLRAALRNNQEMVDLYLGVQIGTVPREEFFNEENMARLLGEPGPR